MIECRNICFGYDGRQILNSFNESFAAGELTALTGKNGCGKTTLTKLIAGILRPESGEILIDENSIAELDLFSIGQLVGYVFQETARQLFCSTVFEEIAYGLKNRGETDVGAKVSAVMEEFHITRLKNDYPRTLSQGEQQRVMLAAVLVLGTRYVMLDEPTTGLDVRGRSELGHTLRELAHERGCGVIVVSHERSFIDRFADREVAL